MANWQNRIVGHEWVDPDQLLANPLNFRIHPKFQQDALEGVLDDIGWIDEITVNKRTQFVVDGHLRVALAITRGEQVPVKYVDLSEDEEALVLAEFDYISALAGTDIEKLDALLKSVNSDNPIIQEMLAGLAESYASPDDSDWENALGGLADGDRAPFQQMTFTLHDNQAETVKRAIGIAKSLGEFIDSGNENGNGNALARVCELFLGDHG